MLHTVRLCSCNIVSDKREYIIIMKKEELEKYVSELPPDLQEKARACKTMQELNTLLAENDVELSEDALQSVAGGCSAKDVCAKGYIFINQCPCCGGNLKYHDTCYENGEYVIRAHCVKTSVLYWKTQHSDKWRKYYN